MIRFAKSLAAWGTPQFRDILKHEIEQLDPVQLPLQAGLSTASHALDKGVTAMVLGVNEEAGVLRARAGIFYSGVIAGCSCADDPTPVDEHTEYCEVQFDIDKSTAEASVALIADVAD